MKKSTKKNATKKATKKKSVKKTTAKTMKKTTKKKASKKTTKRTIKFKHQLLFVNAHDFDSMYSQIADINDILIDGWRVKQVSPCGVGSNSDTQSAIIVIEKDL
jgi:hypothetical protein